MGWLLLFVAIYVIYKIATKKHTPNVPKMTAFDSYLIQHHKESVEKAKLIPDIVPDSALKTEQETPYDLSWIDDLYLGMIKSEKYDTTALRKEAIEAMNITEERLDELLDNYKLDNKKKK